MQPTALKSIKLILFLLFALLLIACSCTSQREPAPNPIPSIPSNLQYFGYYGSAAPWRDINTPDVIGKLAPISNLLWGFGDDVPTIMRADSLHVQIIMDVQSLLLPDLYHPYTSDQMRAVWEQTAREWDDYIADGTVLGVTVGDELYWRAEQAGIGRPFIKQEMERAIEIIHEYTPTLIVVVNEAEREINADWLPPEGADWLGFDCYLGYAACQIPEHLATLEARMNPFQRAFLVPEAYLNGVDTEEQITEDLERYTGLAGTDSRVIALIPFLFHCTDKFQGLSCLSPQTQTAFFNLGTQIKERG